MRTLYQTERAAAIKIGHATLYKPAYRAVEKCLKTVHIRTFYLTVSGKADRCHCKAPFCSDKKKNKPYLRLTNTADYAKARCKSVFNLFFDELNNITDSLDLLNLIIGDLDVELFFKAHNEVNNVK